MRSRAERAFRRLTLFGLALGFALSSFGGATAQAPDEAAVNPSEPKPDTLHVLYTGVEANIDAMHYAADKYVSPNGDAREALAEMAAHSNYYDVTVGDMPWGSALTPHLVNVLPYALNSKVTDSKLLGPSDIIPQLVVESTYSFTTRAENSLPLTRRARCPRMSARRRA